MVRACDECGGLYATENLETFAGKPCHCPNRTARTEKDKAPDRIWLERHTEQGFYPRCTSAQPDNLSDFIEYSRVTVDGAPTVDTRKVVYSKDVMDALSETFNSLKGQTLPVSYVIFAAYQRLATVPEFTAAAFIAASQEPCKCGLEKDDPIHSFSTEWQQMHAFIPKSAPLPSPPIQDAAMNAAEEVCEFYARRYNENVWDKDIQKVAAIIQKHFTEGQQ